MSTLNIAKGIYSVGILNPNMRIFDVIMTTEYGTTYNAFIVKGTEKTALIETSHGKFFDEFLENISQVVKPEEIDYIILNHTEPDHSGALKKLLQLMPQAIVMGSVAAGIYLKEIVNEPLPFRAIKDNESLDLGGRVLKFISAPFLHWPDSIFTLIENEGILFTCDFFGCHYCEPRMFDYLISYKEKYQASLESYYKAIFAPFSPFVRKGLAKIEGMEFSLVCPSHGPILTKETFDDVKEKYINWSAPHVNEKQTIEIFYVSAYGCTEAIAKEIKTGIQSTLPEAKVETYDIIKFDRKILEKKLELCDAFLVGTPTINKDMLAPVSVLLSFVDPIANKGKKCAVFGSFGWSGEGAPNAVARLKSLGLQVKEESFTVKLVPSEKDLKEAFTYGANFAREL